MSEEIRGLKGVPVKVTCGEIGCEKETQGIVPISERGLLVKEKVELPEGWHKSRYVGRDYDEAIKCDEHYEIPEWET